MCCDVQVTGPSTSHVVPPLREDGVPAVAKYAPRFKPQTSAGNRGTAPKKVAEEDKALLAPTTFQSMFHCSQCGLCCLACAWIADSTYLSLLQAHKQPHSSLPITQHLKVHLAVVAV